MMLSVCDREFDQRCQGVIFFRADLPRHRILEA